jgi:hypothetical protein
LFAQLFVCTLIHELLLPEALPLIRVHHPLSLPLLLVIRVFTVDPSPFPILAQDDTLVNLLRFQIAVSQ